VLSRCELFSKHPGGKGAFELCHVGIEKYFS